MNLFDDIRDDDIEKMSKIQVNREFAKRYEHNKKREELQKLEELKKGLVHDLGSDSESDSEVEDEVVATKKSKELLDALMKIRNKDPILKDQDAKLFKSSRDDEDGVEEERGERKKKPKKDVIAQQLIEGGPEFGWRRGGGRGEGNGEGEELCSGARGFEEGGFGCNGGGGERRRKRGRGRLRASEGEREG